MIAMCRLDLSAMFMPPWPPHTWNTGRGAKPPLLPYSWAVATVRAGLLKLCVIKGSSKVRKYDMKLS